MRFKVQQLAAAEEPAHFDALCGALDVAQAAFGMMKQVVLKHGWPAGDAAQAAFSLAVTFLKAIDVISAGLSTCSGSGSSRSKHDMLQLCFSFVSALLAMLRPDYVEHQQASRQSSSQQQRRRLEQQQTVSLLLRARALAVLGRVLPRSHSAESVRGIFDGIGAQPLAASWLQMGEDLASDELSTACEVAEAVGASLRSMQLPGEAAAAAAARQQLQQQHQQLLLAFQSTLAVLPPSTLNTRSSRSRPAAGVQDVLLAGTRSCRSSCSSLGTRCAASCRLPGGAATPAAPACRVQVSRCLWLGRAACVHAAGQLASAAGSA